MPRKIQKTLRVYNVFIASPGDVATERSVAFDVIKDLNRIYENQGNDYRLEVRAWEKHTHPDLGLPQEVIRQQISISECDVFIGVFWKRFGTPSGNIRPNDGRPYLSGTEEEIAIAVEARNTNAERRPVIMLYQKTDPLTDIDKEDRLQYAKVEEFFKQCEPGGEHPALVEKFSDDQFRDVLRDHLLNVIADFESQVPPISVKEPNTSTPCIVEITKLRARLKRLDSVEIETLCLDHFSEVYDKLGRGLRRDETINLLLDYCHRNPEEGVRLDALLRPVIDRENKDGTIWLKRVGLVVNPFKYWITEENIESLNSYRVQPQILHSLDEEIRNAINRRLIFFAPKGWGKTALCKLIAKSHYPLKEKDDILCIVCGRKELEEVITYANHSLEALDTTHYITVIRELILANMRYVSQDNGISDKPGVSICQGLEALTEIVHQHGFKSLMCLVDQVDEVGIVESQPGKMAQLLRPLMRVSWQTIPDITFRYFLPDSLEQLLREQNDIFNLGRYRLVHLKWELADLQELIMQRLRTSSDYSITSLGQLCEPVTQFESPIDQAIVQLAEGSPRATIWLVNRLIELHCQVANPLPLIQPATWEQVRTDWQNWGRSQLFGAPVRREGFVLVVDRICFQNKEITLSKKSAALLRCLIQAGERGCSKGELIRAGWPDTNTEGVTENALTEAVRRMKAELKKKDCDSRWVTTVHGRGYRLQKPKGD